MTFRKFAAIASLIVLALSTLTGCKPTQPTPTEVPADSGACTINPASGESELYGLWVYETDGHQNLLTVTESSLYLVEYKGSTASDSIQERYFTVESADWEAGILTLTQGWERENGKMIKENVPNQVMTFKITDGSLFFNIGNEPSSDLSNGPWIEK